MVEIPRFETIHAHPAHGPRVASAREALVGGGDRAGTGVVRLGSEVRNQHGEVVQDGHDGLLVSARGGVA